MYCEACLSRSLEHRSYMVFTASTSWVRLNLKYGFTGEHCLPEKAVCILWWAYMTEIQHPFCLCHCNIRHIARLPQLQKNIKSVVCFARQQSLIQHTQAHRCTACNIDECVVSSAHHTTLLNMLHQMHHMQNGCTHTAICLIAHEGCFVVRGRFKPSQDTTTHRAEMVFREGSTSSSNHASVRALQFG